MRGAALGRAFGAALAAAILALDASPPGRQLLGLPAAITVAVGQDQALALDLPGGIAVKALGPSADLRVDDSSLGAGWVRLPGGRLELQPLAPGEYVLALRPLDVLPWRRLEVRAVGVPAVAAGGQSVGLLLRLRGDLVTQAFAFPGAAGRWAGPAAAAGIRAGDYLLSVGGVAAGGPEGVSGAAERAGRDGRALSVTVLQGAFIRRLRLRPAYDPRLRRYALGLRLEDAVTGIGTLTFYQAAAGVFAALGHVVTDADTGRPVRADAGELLASYVAGVEPSRDGAPGEKLAVLVAGAPPLGVVRRNTAVGVFGRLLRLPPQGAVRGTMPVALADQVHAGPATMLTVVHGGRVVGFAVRILDVDAAGPPGGRGLVLEVTDPRLLAASGGIVQGMSGSPILQGGRLVGALTHVLVNDPARGYGVLAARMAAAAGLAPPG